MFHDALKGWSCCNKKSTDFTQFLSIPGCTRSKHSNEKPPEPEKPARDESKKDEVYVYHAPKIAELTPRPSVDENLIELTRCIQSSLTQALLVASAASNQTQTHISNGSLTYLLD